MKGLAVSSESSRTRVRSTLVAMIGVPASRWARASFTASEPGPGTCGPGLLLQPRERLLDGLQVGQDQLGLDRGDVVARVDLAVDVGDVLVTEDPGDLADRGRLPDVGEELVAQPLTLRGAADDAGDVDELDGRGKDLGRAEDLCEPREPLVRDADHADVRLDGRERVVRREHVVLGQGVEEGGLARVGESDDADGECHGRSLRRAAACPDQRSDGSTIGPPPGGTASRTSTRSPTRIVPPTVSGTRLTPNQVAPSQRRIRASEAIGSFSRTAVSGSIVVTTQRAQPLTARKTAAPIRIRRQSSSTQASVPAMTTLGRNRVIGNGGCAPPTARR